MKKLKLLAVSSALALSGIALVAHADPPPAPAFSGSKPKGASATPAPLTLDSWLNGPGVTAGWFGLAPGFKKSGLTISGEGRQDFFGQLDGGGLPNQPRNNTITEIKLKFLEDFSVFGVKGLTFQSGWRYRGVATNPAYAAGTSGPSSLFQPSSITSGAGIRILSQQFEFTTQDKKITFNFGWENPQEQFLQQPLSKLFNNSNISSAKGIGGTAGPGIPVINPDIAPFPGGGTPTKGGVRFYTTSPVPWSSSYNAWGATLKIKPAGDFYIQSGLYESIPVETGVNPTQFLATNVYPYTSVPRNYLGTLRFSGQVSPVVGGDGRIIPGAMQNLGWIPSVKNNHGFAFGGVPGFAPSAYVAVKPTTGSGGTIYGTSSGAATYQNSAGQFVASPALYANSPYDQGGLDGNYASNGLYSVNEIGWTPKFGPDKLEGKFALGGYIWGQPNSDYTPTAYTVSVFNPATNKVAYTSYGATRSNPFEQNAFTWGIYLQADQQLLRVHGSTPSSTPFSSRGLYTFNEFTFTPPQNNALPLYFQTGLVFNGPLDSRPNDSIGIALGAGFYSPYLNRYTQSQNQQFENAVGSAYNATVPAGPTQQGAVNPTTGAVNTGNTSASPLTNYYAPLPNYTSTEIIEAFYKIQLNKWAAFKPDVQYIINPAGNGTVRNDVILGFTFNVTF